jgi:hypothetical protein
MLLTIDPEMLKAIAAIAWPTILLFVIIVLGKPIYKIVKEAKDITVEIGGTKFTVSRYVADTLIKPIKDELEEAAIALTEDQKTLFREIYKVIEGERGRYFVPSDFVRKAGEAETQALKDYRALRNVNFIRPALGGQWRPGKEVQIKNFGKLAAQMLKKELGF